MAIPGGEVLLNRRADTRGWALLGGIVDPGEQPADAVVREVYEEAGIRVVPARLTGVDQRPVSADGIMYAWSRSQPRRLCAVSSSCSTSASGA